MVYILIKKIYPFVLVIKVLWDLIVQNWELKLPIQPVLLEMALVKVSLDSIHLILSLVIDVEFAIPVTNHQRSTYHRCYRKAH